jgi:hypothetical protein
MDRRRRYKHDCGTLYQVIINKHLIESTIKSILTLQVFNPYTTTPHTKLKMQFSIISAVAVLAATATASYVPMNGTATSAAYYPTGTGAAQPTGARPTSTLPFTGGASNLGGSALGLIVAGGVALVSFLHVQLHIQDNLLMRIQML